MEPDDSQLAMKLRRVYGRGFGDGVREAQKQGAVMKAEALEQREQALNGIARKVLDVLSETTAMSPAHVVGALNKLTGSNADFRVVQGCLAKLVEQRLAREVQPQRFMRIVSRKPLAIVETQPKQVVVKESHPIEDATMKSPVTTSAAMDSLSKLAKTAEELSAMVAEFAQEVRAAQLAALEEVESMRADSEKLRQLQALLKGIA